MEPIGTLAPVDFSPGLILASASLRRQELLCELGLTFQVIAANLDETPLDAETPVAMTRRLAAAKAQAVAALLPSDGARRLIIASDTAVAKDGTVYGKPLDAADARRMLVALRHCSHQVFSAVSVLETPAGVQRTRVNETWVTMRNYTDVEIDDYVNSGDPLDKAGAYGIQAQQFSPVAALTGCYAGVMGLPLAELRELLADFGLLLPCPIIAVCARHNPNGCCAA